MTDSEKIALVLSFFQYCANRVFYMSAHVILNLLNELGKRDQMRELSSIYLFLATCFINSIIQEHE